MTIKKRLFIMSRDVQTFTAFVNRLKDPGDLNLTTTVEGRAIFYLTRPDQVRGLRDISVLELTGPLGQKSIDAYTEIRRIILYKDFPFHQISESITPGELEKISHEINRA